jgi:hypothetical protein
MGRASSGGYARRGDRDYAIHLFNGPSGVCQRFAGSANEHVGRALQLAVGAARPILRLFEPFEWHCRLAADNPGLSKGFG